MDDELGVPDRIPYWGKGSKWMKRVLSADTSYRPSIVLGEYVELDRTSLCGVTFKITRITQFNELLQTLASNSNTGYRIYTVNMEFLYWARRNRRFLEALNRGDTTVDSAWVRRLIALKYGWAPDQIAGSRFTPLVVEYACRNNLKILFVGGSRELHVALRRRILSMEKGWGCSLRAKYLDPGKVSLYPERGDPEVDRILEAVKDYRPSIVLVALGPPKQEILIDLLWEDMKRNGVVLVAGVGGSLKMLAGLEKPAPEWVSKLLLEWFYRLVQDPKRRLVKVYRSVVALGCALWEAIGYRVRG